MMPKQKKVLIDCMIVICIRNKLDEVVADLADIQETVAYELKTSKTELTRLNRILKRQLNFDNGGCAAPHCRVECAYRKGGDIKRKAES